MKKYSDKTHALFMATAWTFSAILAIALTLYRDTSQLQIAVAALFIFDAVIWWINYAKKRQEEQNHE